jgi:hypothetical protein
MHQLVVRGRPICWKWLFRAGGSKPLPTAEEMLNIKPISAFMRSSLRLERRIAVAVGCKTGLWYSGQTMRLNRPRGPNVR